jgi:hypothetical protein
LESVADVREHLLGLAMLFNRIGASALVIDQPNLATLLPQAISMPANVLAPLAAKLVVLKVLTTTLATLLRFANIQVLIF